jgi:integrase
MASLTAAGIKGLKPGMHADAGGLYLQKRDSGSSWIFRFKFNGKSRYMGLGAFPAVTLAEARGAAGEARKLVRTGIDPIAKRDADKAAIAAAVAAATTFQQAAEAWIASHSKGWSGAHAKAVEASLAQWAYPLIGGRPVADIGVPDVLKVLAPMWESTPETGVRVRGRIEQVMSFASVRGWRADTSNPAIWRGNLAHVLPKRSKVRPVRHHAALAWKEIPEFMAAVRMQEGFGSLALQLAILTAARSAEVLQAKWSEFDLDAKLWVIPARRMKSRVEHRIPLSAAAVEVVSAMLPWRNVEGGDWLFPGTKRGRCINDMAMQLVLRRMDRDELSVHGMRATFRSWTAEATQTPDHVAEMALAHSISSAVVRAYQHSDLLDRRRVLMDSWADCCSRAAAGGNVIPIRAA